ncbi:hypothetical protein Hanom_Chr04g00365521 [Helianthus anomalus]
MQNYNATIHTITNIPLLPNPTTLTKSTTHVTLYNVIAKNVQNGLVNRAHTSWCLELVQSGPQPNIVVQNLLK